MWDQSDQTFKFILKNLTYKKMKIIDIYASILIREFAQNGSQFFLECNLFKRISGTSNININTWIDFFDKIRRMVDNQMLSKIVYVPLFLKTR